MKLPDSTILRNIDTHKPHPIGDEYSGQLLLITMIDGSYGIYNGEDGMEQIDWYKKSELIDGIEIPSLTHLIKTVFPNVQSVKVFDL